MAKSKDERLISGERQGDDLRLELTLRPTNFDEYIGQTKIKENLRVFVTAACRRGQALDHVLLCGPPGLGKTTLAHIIAGEMGKGIRASSGPAIERKGDLAGILTNLKDGEVLFLDEIHRLSPAIEEYLYPALEEFALDIVYGEGPHARSLKLPLKHFTLVGATTRAGLLTSPLRGRFGVHTTLDYYSASELAVIIDRSARILRIPIDEEGREIIAGRSRGTPRVANRLLKRVRDFAEVEGEGRIDRAIAEHALERLEVDHAGLDPMDQKILLTIIDKFSGGPVGVDTLAAAVSEDRDTIEEVYEPYLIKEGLIARTPRGREATPRAYEHLGRTPGSGAQATAGQTPRLL